MDERELDAIADRVGKRVLGQLDDPASRARKQLRKMVAHDVRDEVAPLRVEMQEAVTALREEGNTRSVRLARMEEKWTATMDVVGRIDHAQATQTQTLGRIEQRIMHSRGGVAWISAIGKWGGIVAAGVASVVAAIAWLWDRITGG